MTKYKSVNLIIHNKAEEVEYDAENYQRWCDLTSEELLKQKDIHLWEPDEKDCWFEYQLWLHLCE